MVKANYEVLDSDKNKVVIKDIGGGGFDSVENAAEWVVEELFVNGILKKGQRLLYWNTDGNLNEMLIFNGHFDGFSVQRDTAHGDYHTKLKESAND